MKNNIFRYIFVIIAIGLIGFAVYYLNKDEETVEENVTTEEVTEDNVQTIINLGISELDSLNPLVSRNQNVQDVSKLIYEPLLSITDDYDLENTLAKEWSKVDSTTYLITLRQGVSWHNGGEFTAEDVRYTVEAIKNLGSEYIYYSNVDNIDYVEVVADYIIKIHLFEEEAFFEYNLTFPILSSSFFGEEDMLTSEKSNIPVGTGIYKIKSVDTGSSMELELNTNWWNIDEEDSYNVEQITVKIYQSVAEMYNAYKLGGIDLISTQSSNVEDTIGTVGYNEQAISGRAFDYLALNVTSNALSNKEVRQAINYAINKEEIINTVYDGKYIQADFPLSYGSYLYNETTSSYEYNTDKAKAVLEENGWEYTNGYWQKRVNGSNVKVKLSLVVNSSNENRVSVANLIKTQLEAVRNTSQCYRSKRYNI